MTVPSSQNAPAQTAGASAGPGDRAARPAVVGHRGAALVSPENTLASFRRALDDGAQLLECDVHLSADGELVVMHDQTIDRTAEASSPLRSGAIAELTRAELRSEEHTSELQSRGHLVCRLLLEKKKRKKKT